MLSTHLFHYEIPPVACVANPTIWTGEGRTPRAATGHAGACNERCSLHAGKSGARDGRQVPDQRWSVPPERQAGGCSRSGRSRRRAPSCRRELGRFRGGDSSERFDFYGPLGARVRATARAARTRRRPARRAADTAFRSNRVGTNGRTCGHRAACTRNTRIPRRTDSGKAYQTGTKEASIGSSVHGIWPDRRGRRARTADIVDVVLTLERRRRLALTLDTDARPNQRPVL